MLIFFLFVTIVVNQNVHLLKTTIKKKETKSFYLILLIFCWREIVTATFHFVCNFNGALSHSSLEYVSVTIQIIFTNSYILSTLLTYHTNT